MQSWIADFRYAWRKLFSRAGAGGTLVAIFSIGLGVGVSAQLVTAAPGAAERSTSVTRTLRLYRLTRDGRLPVVRLGRYYRYALAGVEGFEQGGGTHAE
jgi:hypothetical protein